MRVPLGAVRPRAEAGNGGKRRAGGEGGRFYNVPMVVVYYIVAGRIRG